MKYGRQPLAIIQLKVSPLRLMQQGANYCAILSTNTALTRDFDSSGLCYEPGLAATINPYDLQPPADVQLELVRARHPCHQPSGRSGRKQPNGLTYELTAAF